MMLDKWQRADTMFIVNNESDMEKPKIQHVTFQFGVASFFWCDEI